MDAVDEGSVHVLAETLSKIKGIVQDVDSSLGRVAKASTVAENAIKPIAGKTLELNIKGRNLRDSLSAIEEIRAFADTITTSNKVIELGPEQYGVSAYISQLAKLNDAVDAMNESHLRKFYRVVDGGVALRKGNAGLRNYFQQILARAYRPVDAGEVLQSGQEFPQLTDGDRRTLRELLSFFDAAGVDVEGDYVDTTTRFISTSVARLGSACRPQNMKDASAKNASQSLRALTESLVRIVAAQNEDLEGVFDDQQRYTRFAAAIVGAAEGEFSGVARSVNEYARSNVRRDGPLAFEALACAAQLRDALMNITHGMVHDNLGETLGSLQATGLAAMTDFLRFVESRVDSLTQVSNGVSDATMEVMARMRRLSELKNSMILAVVDATPTQWVPNNPKPKWATTLAAMPPSTTEPFDLVAAFFADAIDALMLGLERKAKDLGKKNSMTGFFLQTNLTLVEQTLRQSDLHKILGEYGAARVDRLRKRSLNLFLDGWQAAAQHLMDTTFIQPSKDGKKSLSSKDREAIKEKFKAFNAEFDQLVQRQRSYNLTDPELRNYMADQITSLVRPLYHRFYDRHKDGDFSKNVDKYIKYNKQQFDEVLDSLR